MNSYKKCEHAYIKLDGKDYYDYKAVVMSTHSYYLKHISEADDYIVTKDIETLFDEKNIDKYLDSSFTLKSGDEIHVVPECKYCIKDIRNNYKIKREFDSGVCNVFSPIKEDYYVHVKWTFVIEKLKVIVFLDYCNTKYEAFNEICKNLLYSDINMSDCYISSSLSFVVASDRIKYYIPLLLGTAKKPCVSYKKIEFNTNELTLDVLTLLKKAGSRHYAEKDAKENFLIQLAVLNQHNWREYPLSVHAVFAAMNKRCNVMRDVFSCTSKYPKYVKEMWNVYRSSTTNINKKDVDMVRDFYITLLGLKNETMFVSELALRKKMDEEGVEMCHFNKVFDLVTRITPKKYD